MLNTDTDPVRAFFRPDMRDNYDFSQSPTMIRSRQSAVDALAAAGEQKATEWEDIQTGFLERAKREQKYPKEKLAHAHTLYSAYFEQHGRLRGHVLDIGGGWGLYREWWTPGEGDVYIVHDPGVDRVIEGAHPTHYECYQRAFSLPMTFVEGVGEVQPYVDGTFDTCVIAAALDHCADPPAVLREARRCLKPGGRMVLLESCSTGRPGAEKMRLVKRALQHVHHPRLLVRKVFAKVTAPEDHMYHFSRGQLVSMLEDAGFRDVRVQPVLGGIHAFDAVAAGS